MKTQIIEKSGEPEYAVIPYQHYLKLLEALEIVEDIRNYKQGLLAIKEGEELIPGEIVDKLLDGENPIKVWREYRKMTQEDLAIKSGISKPYLSQLETGKRQGSASCLQAIAHALNVTIDDLMSEV